MKSTILISAILCFIKICNFDHCRDLKFNVREVNIDTSNFKTNNFENNDVSFLIEISNNSDKEIILNDFNKQQFTAQILTNENQKKYYKLNISFNPIYLQIGRSYDLRVLAKRNSIFILGITCLEFNKTSQYVRLNKKEKLEFIKSIIKNIKIYSKFYTISNNINKTKLLYRSIYYPHNPNKPYPLKPKTIIIK